jgi:hypothetical protein
MRNVSKGLLLIAFATLFLHAQVHAKHLVHVDATSAKAQKTALLIMNGFGGSKAACKAQLGFWRDQGMDVFIPEVLLRPSLETSSEAMDAFMATHHLEDYKEVKVICYIAGAYLLHTFLVEHELPNLTSIVYDRSPTQERAPRAVIQKAPLLGKLSKGRVLEDLSTAEWPEPPAAPSLSKGLMIENRATSLMRFLEDECMAMGPLNFDWRSIDSDADDAFHIALDHDMMYLRWDLLGAAVLHFFETGNFPSELSRERLAEDPFDKNMVIP